MNSRKSSTLRRGLKTNELKTRLWSSDESARRSSVVFPVPTSPVRTMKPLCAEMPYSSVARASRVCGIIYRKRGSGLLPNGFIFRWKKLLYMASWCIDEQVLCRLAAEDSPQTSRFGGLFVH